MIIEPIIDANLWAIRRDLVNNVGPIALPRVVFMLGDIVSAAQASGVLDGLSFVRCKRNLQSGE